MPLLDSLLSAIVRADGDALVMHVGERPYVVVGTQTINISTHGLNLDAMTGMLGQLLPAESQTQLEEFGAVEYKIPPQGEDRFSVVAARGGDDIWIEIRRRRPQPEAAAAPAPAAAPPEAVAAPPPPPIEAPVEAPPVIAAEAVATPIAEPAPAPIAEPAPEPVAEPAPVPAPIADVAPIAEPIPEPIPEAIPEPIAEPIAEPVAEVAPLAALAPAASAEPIPEPVAPIVPEPVAAAEALPDAITELLAEPMPVFAREMPVEIVTTASLEVAQAGALEAPQAPQAPEAPQAPAYGEATAYDPILSEVEEPEPYLIDDNTDLAAMGPAFAEAAASEHGFVETAAAPPVVEEPKPIAASIPTPPVIEEPKPIAASIPTLPVIEEPKPIAASIPTPPVVEEPAPTFAETTVDKPIAASIPVPPVVEEHAPTFAEATVDKPIAASVAMPLIEEPAPIAASVAMPRVEEPAPTFAEATVDKPIAASITTPAIEEPLPIAASIESPRVEPARHELPRLDTEPAHEHSVVLPMTRTVRIEVPPRTTGPRVPTSIDRLLRVAAARGATALFLTSDSRPWMRIEGDLRYLDSETTLSRADVESAILEIAPESGQESIGRGEPTEWISEFENVGRIRCTTFADHRGPGVLLRMIATKAATAEALGLAREVQALATEPQGIVLVAGPRASGKSTLISALVDLVNRQRAEYVITLERQIRLVHDNKQALVSQREIRGGADDSVIAARAALRESPDVLVVDDLVSSHMVPLLLTAAAEGLLVFVSITAPSTAVAIERFVELAPPEMRKAVQNAMAESFRGAVAQTLLKKAGGGLIPAREVLLATAPVTRVIGEGQLAQLPLTLESGRKHGMVSFNDALVDFVRSGTVDVREAFRKAPDRNRLLESLKRNGIDTSAVERLA